MQKRRITKTAPASVKEALQRVYEGLPEQASFGDRVRSFRNARLMTQESLAAAAGVSRSAVAQWESDLAVPSRDNRQAASKALKVPPSWLMPG